MGMFDSVMVICPDCNTQIELQSKAGDCSLYSYNIDDMPASIGDDLKGSRQFCDHCKNSFVIEQVQRPIYKVRKYNHEDDTEE